MDVDGSPHTLLEKPAIQTHTVLKKGCTERRGSLRADFKRPIPSQLRASFLRRNLEAVLSRGYDPDPRELREYLYMETGKVSPRIAEYDERARAERRRGRPGRDRKKITYREFRRLALAVRLFGYEYAKQKREGAIEAEDQAYRIVAAKFRIGIEFLRKEIRRLDSSKRYRELITDLSD